MRMNKLMAILFSLGAIGGFGLSQRQSYETQSHSIYGAPAGEVRTIAINPSDRAGYAGVGAVCAIAALFFIVRVRRDDSRGVR
jgi:hypothetical protein